MSTLASKAFWVATSERAVKTVAQSLLSLWLVGDVALNAFTIDWESALGVGLGAGLVSVLTSIVSSPAGNEGPALFGPERVGPTLPPV